MLMLSSSGVFRWKTSAMVHLDANEREAVKTPQSASGFYVRFIGSQSTTITSSQIAVLKKEKKQRSCLCTICVNLRHWTLESFFIGRLSFTCNFTLIFLIWFKFNCASYFISNHENITPLLCVLYSPTVNIVTLIFLISSLLFLTAQIISPTFHRNL